MRIRIAAVLLVLTTASGAVAQSPTLSQQPSMQSYPARLGASDVKQFRSLRASSTATTAGEGSQATAYPVQPTAYQQPQEDNKVPAILSGNSPSQAAGPARAEQNKPATAMLSASPLGRPTNPAALTSTSPGGLPPAAPLQPRSTSEPLRNGSTLTPVVTQEKAGMARETAGSPAAKPIAQAHVPATTGAPSTLPRAVAPIAAEEKPGRIEKAVATEAATAGAATAAPNAGTATPKGAATVANVMVQPQDETRQTGSATSPVLTAPGASIHVNTVGPKSISVGKNATYEITVTNHGTNPANQLAVTFATPNWIEIANTNLTSGTKEVLREGDAVRMVWRIDRLEAGKSQRLILDVIPRKAQVFDLNVEWSLAPVGGAVQVQVTEPMLKMAITGPDEVQYGQTVLYNVAIRNPGTGVAENVNIMLSEALGGERASLGNIGPGEEKNLQVELIARSAGQLELSATVNGDGNLKDTAAREITVRRAQLKIEIEAPAAKYAGTTGNVLLSIENTGDAIAQDVLAAIGLPAGIEYVSGIDAAERMDSGLRWNVGSLTPGAKRTYRVTCLFNASGEVQIDAGVRGAGDLADAGIAKTQVETLADLVLTVDDPRGPLPVGEDVTYQIRITNRGTKAATNLELVMHFSNGIEPTMAEGVGHKLNPGEVLFDAIPQLDPNDEVVLKVVAKAALPGSHAYRAQLSCVEADSREMAGGTTKFYGDEGTLSEASQVPVSQPPAVEPALDLGQQPSTGLQLK